jgi:type VI secretion system protein ImpF
MTADAGDAAGHGADRPHGGVADRLWPVLLDRLTDLEPDKRKESLQARVLTRKAYREGVLRDLQWLLNATNLEASIDFSAHPDAQRSVINFGLTALSGRIASSVDAAQLEAAIRQAIIQFEPRLLPHSIDVKVGTSERSLDMHNVLAVTIRGELWSIPYPLEILLRSDIDLETGQVVLHDQSRGE